MRKHHVICRPERNKNPRDFHEKPDDELSRPAVHTQKVRAFTRVSDKDTILHTKDEYQTLYCSLWGSFNSCLSPHFLWELVFASARKKPEFWKSHCWSSGGPWGQTPAAGPHWLWLVPEEYIFPLGLSVPPGDSLSIFAPLLSLCMAPQGRLHSTTK